MKAAVESIFGNYSVALAGAYDPDKIYAGGLNLGFKDSNGCVSPLYSSVARPNEQSTAIPAQFVWAMRWSATEDWVFYSDGVTAATTRRIGMYKFNRTTGVWAWQGFITITPMGTGNATIRGFRMTYDLYTTGTVSCTGTTTVTGNGTLWGATAGSAQIAAGSRIGFGTTDPTQVSTWYEISSVPSDTGFNLTAAGPNTGGNVSYVIEELRAVVLVTNATPANGGLFVVKGLRPEIFLSGGTSVSMATTVDRTRNVYWMADAATISQQTGAGIAIEPRASNDVHYVYGLDGASTTAKFFKYNIRAPLTGLSAGKPTNYSAVCPIITSTQTAVAGNVSQNNNCRYAVAGAGGGPGNGVASIYFCTTTRIVRVATANITASSTTFISDSMTEVPPGATTTAAATGAMSSIEHIGSMDRFYIGTTGATAFRSYLTNYRTDAGQIDHFLFQDQKFLDQASADQRFGPLPFNTQSLSMNMWVEGGMAYIARHPLAAGATTAAQNALFAVPLGADIDYVGGNTGDIIFPRIATPGATKLSRVAAIDKAWYYDLIDGPNGEYYQLYYRTAGITDNSGAWTVVPDKYDLSGVTPGSYIQFCARWNMIGIVGLPIRLCGLVVTYDTDDSLPSEMRWNIQDSVDATGVVGFIQTTSFGVFPSTLTITYRRLDTDAIVLTQASSGTTNGTFEYHNGSTWAAGLGPNTIGTRRRFTPVGLPGVAVYAKITNP